MKKEKEKTYLVFIEQCDDETICKRMSGDEIRSLVKENDGYQEFIAIIEGNLLKEYHSKIDLTRL